MSDGEVLSVRTVAARVLDRVLDRRLPAHGVLEAARSSLSARDAALLHEMVLGSLRWLGRLDQVLEAAARRPLSTIDRALRGPLRLALFQILYLDRVPAHAAVDQAVKEVKRRGLGHAAGFANAVLRRVSDRPLLADWPVEAADPVVRLAIENSHPEWLVRRWLAHFGHRKTEALLAANNRPRPPGLLAFRDRGGRDGLRKRLAAERVTARLSRLSPLGLVVEEGDVTGTAAFRDGELYIQDPASQTAAWVPPPMPGESVLDLAAAPGGKSFALLAWEADLRLTAADLALARLEEMRGNLVRLRRRLPLIVADAARPPVRAAFDRVLLDLPCSGTGTLRKHPELKWRLRPEELARLAGEALRLSEGAVAALRPGGLLCCITCSIEPEENERIVEQLLARRTDLRPEPLAARLPEPLREPLVGECGWRVLPSREHDGFTVHVLRRGGGSTTV